MNKQVQSFSIGASTKDGIFLAIVLKFKFENSSDELIALPRPMIAKLLQALTEYYNHLIHKKYPLDSDALEHDLKKNAPPLSLEEIADLSVSCIASDATFHVRSNDAIEITFSLGKNQSLSTITIQPNQCEWIVGYIGNTLNEFDENGEIFKPEGMAH